MATKTQIRLTLTLAAIVAAATVAMPDMALAYYRGGAPEVDPSTLGSAIALAMGGAAILRDKLRR